LLARRLTPAIDHPSPPDIPFAFDLGGLRAVAVHLGGSFGPPHSTFHIPHSALGERARFSEFRIPHFPRHRSLPLKLFLPLILTPAADCCR
jgi:hypothetical protein